MDEELTCCAIQPKDNNHSSERDEKKKSQYLLLIAAVEKGDYGEYQRVTNTSVGKITSTEAFISPKYRDAQVPTIVEDPNQSVLIGSNVTFNCTAAVRTRSTIMNKEQRFISL